MKEGVLTGEDDGEDGRDPGCLLEIGEVDGLLGENYNLCRLLNLGIHFVVVSDGQRRGYR
jgi:hypothetical protein